MSFCMPEIWWSDLLQNANGYFGCECKFNDGIQYVCFGYGLRIIILKSLDTWAYFEAKHLHKPYVKRSNYSWTSLSLFTRWFPSIGQTAILLFDPTEEISLSLFEPEPEQLHDPFWV